jgi:hypothetical protein
MILEYHDVDRTTLTDDEGLYTFTDIPITDCLKKISASKKDYLNQSEEVGIDELTVVDFALEPRVQEPIPGEGVLMGTVTDVDTEEPIEGALMTLEYHDVERTTVTDDEGQYQFTGIPICNCSKGLLASKDNYQTQSKQVTVGEITVVNFVLDLVEPQHSIDEGVLMGIVTDAKSGKPIGGVLMVLEYHEVEWTTRTDIAGRYTFSDVSICDCMKEISASIENYQDLSMAVEIDGITYQNFTLDPLQPSIEDEITTENHEPDSIWNDEQESLIKSQTHRYAITGLTVFSFLAALVFTLRLVIRRRKGFGN